MTKVEDITKLIKKVDINTLKIDPDNPNIMSQEEMDRLSKSLDIYGFLYPLICDQNNIILDGNHRYELYKNKGMKVVPVIQINFNSEAHRRLIRQSLNKIHGSHEIEKDLKELEIIIQSDAELLKDLVGITEDDLDDMRKAIDGATPHFQRPSEPPEDVINDFEDKKVLHIAVSEELLHNLEQIKKDAGIKGWEELLEELVSKWKKSN